MKTFIEIGTCDFETNIPLIESGEWTGVMCEPAPTYFKNLEDICKDIKHRENLFLDNVAITDYTGHVSWNSLRASSPNVPPTSHATGTKVGRGEVFSTKDL